VKRPLDIDKRTVPALSGYFCTNENPSAKYKGWFKAELPENYNIEAVVLTGFLKADRFENFKVFAS